jgi:hypothetical protein
MYISFKRRWRPWDLNYGTPKCAKVEQNSKAIAWEDKFSVYCSMGILIPRSVPTVYFIWRFLKSVTYKHLHCTDIVETRIVKAISATDNDMLGTVMNNILIHCRKCIKHERKYFKWCIFKKKIQFLTPLQHFITIKLILFCLVLLYYISKCISYNKTLNLMQWHFIVHVHICWYIQWTAIQRFNTAFN